MEPTAKDSKETGTHTSASRGKWLYAFGIAIALVLIWRVWLSIDLSTAPRVFGELGALAILFFLPYLFSILFDSLGWRLLIPTGRGSLHFGKLLRVRMESEALQLGMPLGSFAADSVKPYLLKRELEVEYAAGIASVILRKCILPVSESFFIALASALAFADLRANSEALLGTTGLQYLVIGSALALFVIFGGATALVLYGGAAERLRQFLMWLPLLRPLRTLRAKLIAAQEKFANLGEKLSRMGELPRNIAISCLFYFLMWLAEAFETWVILRLLGANVTMIDAMVIETVVSLLRSLAFFVPSGLGVQDLSYIAFFKAFGIVGIAAPGIAGLLHLDIGHAFVGSVSTVLTLAQLGGAFILIKRMREVLWGVTGYLLLLVRGLTGGIRAASRDGIVEAMP